MIMVLEFPGAHRVFYTLDSVSELDYNSRGRGFKSRQGRKYLLRFMINLRSLSNSAIMSTLTVHCRWEDETTRERTGHPSSYAKAKKLKSVTLYTHGCLSGYLEGLLF